MNELQRLQRHLEEEMQARRQVEEICEKKLSELYQLKQQLEETLSAQYKINQTLNERILELESTSTQPADERYAKGTLQNILESSIEYSIIAIDLDWLILVWNEGARRNYGYTADEMVKKQTINILHTPEDIASGAVKTLFDTAYQNGKAEGVFERIRKNGTRFTASVTVSVRRDDEGKPIGYVIISKDITEKQRTEEKLLKTNQELEQFAYVASHDLKAPLRAIDRLATWIEEDNRERLDDASKENLLLLRQRINRMSNLIDGILQYSRAGRVDLDIHVVNTKELLDEIIDLLDPDKKFKITYSEHLPTFRAAKVPLSQVFSNLIANSIKHHKRKHGVISVDVRDWGRFYEFFVTDDGPGIEAEYFDKIFMIFQTLRSRDELEATGIGLSIVKKIVESQGGMVSVASIVGEGTTFSFTWPKYPEA
ncbi:ATP-binding protein [Legionella sp. 27cVA30]|uniref:sensor histidine kinase n=1 Tax=Legionella TaxID=445 RepID=UPI000F8CF3F3|nr:MULTISPECIES: ATP-binding protein [Legionella]MCP0912946.1 ATP-binding protein [Legionella sp. 27cVA30]RUR15475.1 PAS domain S-box protein [Legionella septentrionalis]